MNSYPKVSVIVPNYNGAKYIEEAIRSLLSQTYSNIEIIIVDDYSSDDSVSIVQEIINKNKDRNITLHINTKNEGPSKARNIGVDLSNGEYIAFLDADDKYANNKIEVQVKYLLENPNVDIVYTDLLLIDKTGEETGMISSIITKENEIEFLVKMLDRQVVPGPASICMKRSCLVEVRYDENMVHAEDYKFTLELAQRYKFARIKAPLYICRRHHDNLTNNHKEQIRAEKAVIKELGMERIEKIINKSSYSDNEKKLIYFRMLLKLDERNLLRDFIRKNKVIFKEDLKFNYFAGIVSFFELEYSNAKKYFERALMIERLPEIYNNIGCIFRMQGEESNAEKMFIKALEMNGNYLDARNNLRDTNEIKLTTNFLRKNLLPYK